ncbi:hypothetical protein QX776_04575 [Alteromonadaceae bacterium BrNp21-10]|nr:hypothetical protein [Alteromonadaceae bacterium BrNp21-10]
MDRFYVILLSSLTFLVLFNSLLRAKKFNTPQRVLEDKGNEVWVKAMPLAKLFPALSHKIEKQQIAKIQLAPRCLTLFTHGDNAIDIFLSSKVIDDIAAYAQRLFPSAEFVHIQD